MVYSKQQDAWQTSTSAASKTVKQLCVPFTVTLLALSLAGASAEATPSHASKTERLTASRCTTGATEAVVRRFAGGYSGGQVTAINRLWASTARFEWFSTRAPGARLRARAKDRATLVAYFRARVRAHERIQLLTLKARYSQTIGVVDFSGRLVRSADDLSPGRKLWFKGATDCLLGRPSLIVWSM